MKTIETTVYTYDELNDKAKETARDWWLQGEDNSIAWEDTQEDAINIGLIIEELETCRSSSNKGKFAVSAIDTANRIISEYGESCETYKSAKHFLSMIEPIENQAIGSDCEVQDNGEHEAEFLQSLLKDYRYMYVKDCEYRTSQEYIEESITSNEYTFTETGKRFG